MSNNKIIELHFKMDSVNKSMIERVSMAAKDLEFMKVQH